MQIATKFLKETRWQETKQEDLLRIIEEELGNKEAASGTLQYIQEACSKNKTIRVGTCEFKKIDGS
jgi:hypothetical protein